MGVINIKEGDRIWFAEEKKPYKVIVANNRYAICTKPYNFIPNTVLYTIVDFERNVRGMDNLVFSIYDYATVEDCARALEALENGDMEVSHRNSKRIMLKITRINNETYL